MQHLRRQSWLVPVVLTFALACNSSTLSNRHPQISVSPSFLDFGIVQDPSPVSKSVTVTNTGAPGLVLQHVAVMDDPGHVFQVQAAPTSLETGQPGTLTVLMTPPAQPGIYGGSLVITSNAANAPDFLVQLSVHVESAQDAGSDDAGGVDAGPEDAGSPDAGAADAGPVDAGTPDAGVPDGACPPNWGTCSGQCVDTQSDSSNCGTCQHQCPDHMGCSGGQCVNCAPAAGITLLAQGQGLPWDVTVDQTSVYWTDGSKQRVMKVGLNGGAPVPIFDGSQLASTTPIVPSYMAHTQDFILFADIQSQNVAEIGLTDGTLVNLGGTTGNPPGRLAASPSAVYWVTTDTGDVWKASFASGSAAILVPGPSGSKQQYEMLGVDANYVYWLAKGTTSTDGAIMRVGLDGGTPTTVLSGISSPRDGAVDGTSVYWTSYGNGTVMKVASAGGTPVTLASGLTKPRSLVVDSTGAYWSAGNIDSSLMSCSGTIQRVGLDGGPVTDLASAQYSPMYVAVDQTSVYWVDWYNGTVQKAPR